MTQSSNMSSGAAAKERTPFVYDSLQEGCIRLGTISRDEHGTILFSMSHFELANAPRFQALSYVWNPPPFPVRPPVSILCATSSASGYIDATWNLFAALDTICDRQWGYIWVDALCINQLNNQVEKSSQVAIMDQIYRAAANVEVWLGVGTPGLRRALILCHWIDAVVDKHDPTSELFPYPPGDYSGSDGLEELTDEHFRCLALALNKKWSIMLTLEACSFYYLPAYEHGVWYDFSELFANPWLTRIWTLQEILLAKHATVRCGDATVSWQSFRDAGVRLARAKLLYHGEALRRHPERALTPVRTYAIDPNDWQIFVISVHEARSRGVSEPADRVFGLLSLAGKVIRQAFPIDYTPQALRNYKTLYKRFTKAMFQCHGLEIMLSLVDPAQMDAALPSWCPQYHKQMAKTSLGWTTKGNAGRFHALTGQLIGEEDVNEDCIRIGGFTVDHVEYVFSDLEYEWDDYALGNTGSRENAAKILTWFSGIDRIIRAQNRETSLSEQLFAEYINMHVPDEASEEVVARYTHSMHVFKSALLDLLDNSNLEDCTFKLGSHFDEGDADLVNPVLTRLQQNWMARVCIITAKGHIGIANRSVMPGDSICAILGSNNYTVLRTKREGGYTFVSLAYLHGQMQGELIRQCKEGEHAMFDIY